MEIRRAPVMVFVCMGNVIATLPIKARTVQKSVVQAPPSVPHVGTVLMAFACVDWGGGGQLATVPSAHDHHNWEFREWVSKQHVLEMAFACMPLDNACVSGVSKVSRVKMQLVQINAVAMATASKAVASATRDGQV